MRQEAQRFGQRLWHKDDLQFLTCGLWMPAEQQPGVALFANLETGLARHRNDYARYYRARQR